MDCKNIGHPNGQGTHSTKMDADSSAENTPNAPTFICPSPKIWDFDEKRLHWASVVRGRLLRHSNYAGLVP